MELALHSETPPPAPSLTAILSPANSYQIGNVCLFFSELLILAWTMLIPCLVRCFVRSRSCFCFPPPRQATQKLKEEVKDALVRIVVDQVRPCLSRQSSERNRHISSHFVGLQLCICRNGIGLTEARFSPRSLRQQSDWVTYNGLPVLQELNRFLFGGTRCSQDFRGERAGGSFRPLGNAGWTSTVFALLPTRGALKELLADPPDRAGNCTTMLESTCKRRRKVPRSGPILYTS